MCGRSKRQYTDARSRRAVRLAPGQNVIPLESFGRSREDRRSSHTSRRKAMNTVTRVTALVAVLEAAVLCFGAYYAAAPAKDGDPVLVGTVWKGKLTQK